MSSAAEIIAAEIKNRGIITFARFMELALYCPVYGFYEAEGDRIGRGGDFYTSVSVGPLFGQLLAFQFADWLQAEPGPHFIVEAGAHRGDLPRDILRWLRDFRPALYERIRYLIVEPSARRKAWQGATLREFSRKVHWVAGFNLLEGRTFADSELDGTPGIGGVIFSNELLDAMPAHRFAWDGAAQRWYEWGVVLDKAGFQWARMTTGHTVPLEPPVLVMETRADAERDWAAALISALAGAASRGEHLVAPGDAWREAQGLFSVLPDGFVVEVCPAARRWWAAAAESLRQGHLVAFDYGYLAEELFVPERTGGTLRAFRRHRASSDLLVDPGEQDLTAHVNFSEIRDAGEAAGLRTEAFTTQGQFLTRSALEMWNRGDLSADVAKGSARHFQTLASPQHLGHAFRVLVQKRQPAGGANLAMEAPSQPSSGALNS